MVIGVTLAIATLFHVLIVTGMLGKLLKITDGFHSGIALGMWLIVLYPATILGAALVVAGLVEQQRLSHFFLAAFVSVGINFFLVNMFMLYNQFKVDVRVQESYESDPQSRPLHDPKRPLSLIDVKVIKRDERLFAQLVVHALPGALDGTSNNVKVKPNPYPDSPSWGLGELKDTGKLSAAGRIIFNGEVVFTPPQDWQEGIIFVIGNERLLDSRRIVPSQELNELQ